MLGYKDFKTRNFELIIDVEVEYSDREPIPYHDYDYKSIKVSNAKEKLIAKAKANGISDFSEYTIIVFKGFNGGGFEYVNMGFFKTNIFKTMFLCSLENDKKEYLVRIDNMSYEKGHFERNSIWVDAYLNKIDSSTILSKTAIVLSN